MDPLLLKSYQSLVPFEQHLIAGLIISMAKKDQRNAVLCEELLKAHNQVGEVIDNALRKEPA